MVSRLITFYNKGGLFNWVNCRKGKLTHLSAFHCWDVDFTDLSLLLPLIPLQFSDQ